MEKENNTILQWIREPKEELCKIMERQSIQQPIVEKMEEASSKTLKDGHVAIKDVLTNINKAAD